MTHAIDRIAPTRRPEGRVAQRQSWLDLTFLHWRIPVAALRPLLPAALEIDTYEGDAFIGVVPFTMTGVRPLWAPPVPGISNFHETNVRTYVHLEGRDPGVWFFSLDAASRVAVTIATPSGAHLESVFGHTGNERPPSDAGRRVGQAADGG